MPDKKLKVYFNEFNVLMENAAYLPLVSGTLQAYATSVPKIQKSYEFMPFLFYRQHQDKVLEQYRQECAVAAFSVSMWNEQLSLKVAELVKRRFPESLIVFGGPQVPYTATDYFESYPFIDVTVRGEGEDAFVDILDRFLESRDFCGIPGISFRDGTTGKCIKNSEERTQKRDLDTYPSPYLEGLYDQLLQDRSDLTFQAIVETNRGCPFPCAFCYWGMGGLSRKYRFYSLERIKAVVDWCGRNQIKYVFNADSNFGMIARDYEIAQAIVDTKKKYGYPEKFRTCFGKNSDEKIYNIAKLLHTHGLEKGITLARQSNDEETLRNIRRENIKLSTYRNLQFQFNEDQIPVYSELILGLPGETYDSWLQGIEELLQCGIQNQLFVYHCQVYPNTEMGDPEYQQKFKMEIIRIPLHEIHGGIREDDIVSENEDIVVATLSMTKDEWRRMAVFSWVLQIFHAMKLGYYVMVYLVHRYHIRYTDFLNFVASHGFDSNRCKILARELEIFEEQARNLQAGQGRGRILRDFGAIYWDEEEASFLRLAQQKDEFYKELLDLVVQFLSDSKLEYDDQDLCELMTYQKARIPNLYGDMQTTYEFGYNLPEYFEKIFTVEPVPLSKKPQMMRMLDAKHYHGDKVAYARDTVLYGRKSGTTLLKVSWLNLKDVKRQSVQPIMA